MPAGARFRNVTAVVTPENAGQDIRKSVAETGDATGSAVLQRPEHQMVGAGIDIEARHVAGDGKIGLQRLLGAARVLDAGDINVSGELAGRVGSMWFWVRAGIS